MSGLSGERTVTRTRRLNDLPAELSKQHQNVFVTRTLH
jgi:hypothetical protein